MHKNPRARARALLARMTLAEKLGQLCQIHGAALEHDELIRRGQVGSVLNHAGVDTLKYQENANRLQRVAVEESRLGIPLLLGRDVIHGCRTILPIPLGQAASFDPEAVRQGARAAAREAAAYGFRWTFAPMVDVARDPRWGRIAEGAGEDPYLAACMGAAMVLGFQGPDLAAPDSIAACAKHFVGYGAAEGGRDYNTTLIPESELRNVYLRPFKACVDAGAATLMSAFNDLNGVPATGNAFTLRRILKGEWGFDGFVVSDWASVTEMIAHGYCAGPAEAARAALAAGVDMEMVSTAYRDTLPALLRREPALRRLLDDAVLRILTVKFRLGLFEDPYVRPEQLQAVLSPAHLAAAKTLALESCVLLKNDGALPLANVRSLAVLGPLADSAADLHGCWAFDGIPADAVTPLRALREAAAGRVTITHVPGLPANRSADTAGIAAAVAAARRADVAVLFLGEDAGMSGEAHSRAFLDLPGAQQQLLDAVAAAGRPVVVVLLTGRPLALGPVAAKANALLLAWHPGTMGGPAIAELLLGISAPSGRLPASFPRSVGQVPLYYNRRNTGRPPPANARPEPMGTPLDPAGFYSQYMDVEPLPLYPFGFGLGYTTFAYSAPRLSRKTVKVGGSFTARVTVTNTGPRAGTEVVQLYVRDVVGSLTRPVKELKGFERLTLAPGESRAVAFTVHTDDLAFHGADGTLRCEPGEFRLWLVPDSGFDAEGGTRFDVLPA